MTPPPARWRRSRDVHAGGGRLREVAAVGARRAARRRTGERPPGRDGAGHHARPRRRRAPRWRRRVADAVDVRRRGSRWARPRTRSTSSGRTGASRRGGRDRLEELGYAPFRDLIAAVLRHAGGVRVDHVIGLFRLWWMPGGAASVGGHLRALRPRGDDRGAGAGGASGPEPSWSARTSAWWSRRRGTTCAAAASWAPRSSGSSATTTATRCPPSAGASCAWRP